jgi:hypothetical protein
MGSADERDRELEKDVAQILLRRKIRSRELQPMSTNCFDISPRKVLLQPNQAVEFTVLGLATVPDKVVENWICRAAIGEEKSLTTLYETKICAQFCRPELRFSHPSLSFSYFSDPQKNDKKPWVEPTQHNLEVTNVCPLPLEVTVKTPSPFTVANLRFSLKPGKSITTVVLFSPVLSSEMVSSSTVNENLIFTFEAHPRQGTTPPAPITFFKKYFS